MADYSDPDVYLSKRYTEKGGRYIDRRQKANFAWILDLLGAEKGDTVLELGSGPALFSDYVSDRYITLAADIEREPLLGARENQRSEEQLLAAGQELPLADDSVDYTVAPRLLHLAEVDEKEVVEEMERVSARGFGFDVFSVSSFRLGYNWIMHRLDEDMPKSNLTTEFQLDGRWPGMIETMSGYESSVNDLFGDNSMISRFWPSEGLLDDSHEVVGFSDFFIPFGYYREENDKAKVEGIEAIQDLAAGIFNSDRYPDYLPDFNSVIYRGVKLESE